MEPEKLRTALLFLAVILFVIVWTVNSNLLAGKDREIARLKSQPVTINLQPGQVCKIAKMEELEKYYICVHEQNGEQSSFQ